MKFDFFLFLFFLFSLVYCLLLFVVFVFLFLIDLFINTVYNSLNFKWPVVDCLYVETFTTVFKDKI